MRYSHIQVIECVIIICLMAFEFKQRNKIILTFLKIRDRWRASAFKSKWEFDDD